MSTGRNRDRFSKGIHCGGASGGGLHPVRKFGAGVFRFWSLAYRNEWAFMHPTISEGNDRRAISPSFYPRRYHHFAVSLNQTIFFLLCLSPM